MSPPKHVLDLVHLKKDRTDAYIYQKLFMEIEERYRDYIPVYTVTCATVVPSNTIIFIFTAEIWAIIKALEEIKNYVASKYTVFTIYEAGTSLGW